MSQNVPFYSTVVFIVILQFFIDLGANLASSNIRKFFAIASYSVACFKTFQLKC